MGNKKIFIIIITLLLIVIVGIVLLQPIFINNEIETIPESTNTINITLGVNPKVDDSSVKISNNNIHINEGGIYNVSGILVNGTIYIDTSDDVTLKFNGITMVNEINSVIDNRKSNKLVINLANNTNNILSDGGTSSATIKSVGDTYIEGNGNLQIFANINNGISSNGNLVIDGGAIYLWALNDVFSITKELLINSGTIIGLGNNNMKIPNELSKQYTMLFNLTDSLPENTLLSLIDNNNKSIVSFQALRDFSTLIISSPQINKGTYHLLQDIECNEEITNGICISNDYSGGTRINIGFADTFSVINKGNWFGKQGINIVNPDNFI